MAGIEGGWGVSEAVAGGAIGTGFAGILTGTGALLCRPGVYLAECQTPITLTIYVKWVPVGLVNPPSGLCAKAGVEGSSVVLR